MRESLRHQEAFDYYFSLGANRSLMQVANRFGVTPQSAGKWSSNFNWQARLEERDLQVAKRMEEDTNQQVFKSKLDYRKEIKESLQVIRAALATAVDALKKGTITAESVGDVERLTSAQDKLVRLDLMLMGEADSRQEHKLIVEHVILDAAGDRRIVENTG